MFNVGAISTKAMKYEKFWPIVMSHQTNFNKLALFPIHLALPTVACAKGVVPACRVGLQRARLDLKKSKASRHRVV